MKTAEEILEEVRTEIMDWDSKQGHDRCHYYPDIFARIATIVGVKLTNEPYLPTRSQLEEGCRRFADEQYSLNVRIVPEEYKK